MNPRPSAYKADALPTELNQHRLKTKTLNAKNHKIQGLMRYFWVWILYPQVQCSTSMIFNKFWQNSNEIQKRKLRLYTNCGFFVKGGMLILSIFYMNCYFWGYFCKYYPINTTQKTPYKSKKISRKQKKFTKSTAKILRNSQISFSTLAQVQKSKAGFLPLF